MVLFIKSHAHKQNHDADIDERLFYMDAYSLTTMQYPTAS